MGSVLIGDVGHHFHHDMLGGNSHQQQTHEASTGSPYPVQAPSRSSQPDAAYAHSRRTSAKDRPATEAVSPAGSQNAASHSRQRSGSGAQASNVNTHATGSVSQRPSRTPQTPSAAGSATSSQTGHNAPVSRKRPGVESASSSSVHISPSRSVRSLPSSGTGSPTRIKVLSLSHIQSFATDKSSAYSLSQQRSRRARRDPGDLGPQYEISAMPVADIIEMVAGLLTKITTTNDRQHEHLHRHIPVSEGAGGLSQQTASVLAFHGKNIPSITILSYLSRIHKYCPTTYEVFLSLLVYFDRMTERVNSGPIRSMRQASCNFQDPVRSRHSRNSSSVSSLVERSSPTTTPTHSSQVPVQAATPPPSGSLGKHEDSLRPPSSPLPADPLDDPYNLSHFFVVDSFNIHRLVIAGVTCASKFFSDVFYTNSRYAKVSTSAICFKKHSHTFRSAGFPLPSSITSSCSSCFSTTSVCRSRLRRWKRTARCSSSFTPVRLLPNRHLSISAGFTVIAGRSNSLPPPRSFNIVRFRAL